MNDLVQRLCPNGVKFKPLGEIGELVRGNGMPRADFVEHGVGCIHYGQIYTHYGTWATETLSFVPAAKAKSLAKVDPGDVIITNTSENLSDVCKAVAWLGKTQIVTGGHATVFKHDEDPKYIAYYLQTPEFDAQKRRYATGTKVMDVSAKSLARLRIPLPPREVQQEIVHVLDLFQSLEAELEAELEARRNQYAYYRQSLMDGVWESPGVARKSLSQVASFTNGKAHERVVDADGEIALMTSRFISTQGKSARRVRRRDVETPAFKDQIALVMSDLPNGRALARAFHVDADDRYAANQRVCLLQSRDVGRVLPRFLYYLVDRNRQLLSYDSGVDQTHLKKGDILGIEVPVPPVAEQARIVGILDKFDALVNDLSWGLPAELAARRTQYEYYRNKLLRFEEAA